MGQREWEWDIPAREAESVDDFGLWIIFGLVSGKTKNLANFIVYMAGIKSNFSKVLIDETFLIFLEGFQLFEISQ